MDDTRFEQTSYGACWWAVVAGACAFALLVVGSRCLASRHRQATLRARDIAWFVPFPLLLTALTIWYACGVGASDPIALVACCALIVASGIVTLCGERLLSSIGWHRRTLRAGAGVVVMGVLTLEFMWNEKPESLGPQFVLIELVLVGELLAALWLACGKRGVGPALGLIALALLGATQHYVLEFRGTSILPSDLFAARTAMSVSGGYTYGLSDGMLGGLGALAVGMSLASLLDSARRLDLADGIHNTVLAQGPLGSVVLLSATLAAMAALACVPNYKTTFGADLDYWWSKDWYERQGFIPSFVYACQDLAISAPEGYSADAAQAAEVALGEQYASDPAPKQ